MKVVNSSTLKLVFVFSGNTSLKRCSSVLCVLFLNFLVDLILWRKKIHSWSNLIFLFPVFLCYSKWFNHLVLVHFAVCWGAAWFFPSIIWKCFCFSYPCSWYSCTCSSQLGFFWYVLLITLSSLCLLFNWLLQDLNP